LATDDIEARLFDLTALRMQLAKVEGDEGIKKRSDQFLINLAPGASVSVPFVDGWVVKDGEVTIRLTPGDGIGAVPSAWAITAEGLVSLK
jgi:hypothetical protein